MGDLGRKRRVRGFNVNLHALEQIGKNALQKRRKFERTVHNDLDLPCASDSSGSELEKLEQKDKEEIK